MKILTLGNGFVSSHLPYEICSDRIKSNKNIKKILENHKPDIVINCIGKTGRPNIDSCETRQAETAFANTALPIMLAKQCQRYSIHLIQIGSGCIFSGTSPHNKFLDKDGNFLPKIQNYSLGDPKYDPWWAKSFQQAMIEKNVDSGWEEKDFANPQSYYSRTKYACDLVLETMNTTILRIRMPISDRNDPRNFINKVKNYSKVIDIPNSMTIMSDLVKCVAWAAKETNLGVFHVTNPEPLSAAQVMREYQKYDVSHKFEIINEKELDNLTIAKRSNCILNTEKLNNAGFFMTPSEEALTTCMASYIKNIGE